MVDFLNTSLKVSLILLLPNYCFGHITRDSFFTNSEGISTKGSFFSGFIFPFKFSHSKNQYSPENIAGLIMQFKDPSNEISQKNKWILRIPSSDSKVHEVKGHFNFDIDSNGILTVDLKEPSGIQVDGSKLCGHSSPLMRMPLIKDLIKESTKAKAQIHADDRFFDKPIILLNHNKKHQYMDGTEVNIQKIKAILYEKKETSALAYRLPDDPSEYIIGIIEPPLKALLKPETNDISQKKYMITHTDFIYLKFNPGIVASHRRY